MAINQNLDLVPCGASLTSLEHDPEAVMHIKTLRAPSHSQANDSSLSAPLPVSIFSLSLSVSVRTGDITQKGYEKKRSKLLAPYIPQIQGKPYRPAG